MTDSFAQTQGGIFGGLNFRPIDWPDFTTPSAVPQLPSIINSTASWPGAQTLHSSGGASTGAAVAANGAPSYAIGAPSKTQVGGDTSSSGLVAGSIADYFARGVIIILGFIFVAVGLHMFGLPVPVVDRIGK